MTRNEQKHFVSELSATITDDIVRAISDGRIPEEWDGHELRALLAKRHAESAAMSLVLREPKSRRARDYRNHLLVTQGL